MARPTERWSYSAGRYGNTVRIYEPRPGAPLRWDYRDAHGDRHRPEVVPPITVRRNKDAPVDPVKARRAEDVCEQRAASMVLGSLRDETDPKPLTLGEAYRLYFDKRRRALPPSRSARIHHEASRAFWERELGTDAVIDTIPPADVLGALKRLKEKGKTPTAVKRLSNLRTLVNWLREDMGYDTLRDPTRGKKLKKAAIKKGHQPRRRRYTPQEVRAMNAELPDFDLRFRAFMRLIQNSGPRGVQAREAMRSGLDCPLEPPPPEDYAPHGWLRLPGVKDQNDMVVFLSEDERELIDEALDTYLAEWEAAYQAGEMDDYPLFPAGRMDRTLSPEPISDTALRKQLHKLEDAADVEHKDWRGFHGFRRRWVDVMDAKVGLDTAAHAGGWSDTDMVEGVYVSRVRYDHLERARRAKDDG